MKIYLILPLFLLVGAGLNPFAQGATSGKSDHISIQLPEVQELFFIMYALSDGGLNDTVGIHQGTEYYSEVMQYFSKYREQPFIRRIERACRNQFNEMRMGACNYYFDDNGEIVKQEGISHFSWGKKEVIEDYIPAMNEFAKVSNFRNFYRDHVKLYRALIDKLDQAADPSAQKSG